MTPAEQTDLARLDAERRKNERDLLILLLLFANRAQHYATHAARLGMDPATAVGWVIGGSARPHFPGMASSVARVLASTHAIAHASAVLMVGATLVTTTSTSSTRNTSSTSSHGYGPGELHTVTRKGGPGPKPGAPPATPDRVGGVATATPPVAPAANADASQTAQQRSGPPGPAATCVVRATDPDALTKAYEPIARQFAGKLVTSMQRAIADTAKAAGAHEAITAAPVVAATVREAFASKGYTARKPFALASQAITLANTAWNAGMWAAYRHPCIWSKLTALYFDATLDAGTTEICRCRDGVRLPKDDPYWTWNTPALHWRCRSILMPVFTPEYKRVDPPMGAPPPMPGFGAAPWFTFGYSAFGNR